MTKIVRAGPSKGTAEAGNTEEVWAVQDLLLNDPAFSTLKEKFFVFSLSRIEFLHERRCH